MHRRITGILSGILLCAALLTGCGAPAAAGEAESLQGGAAGALAESAVSAESVLNSGEDIPSRLAALQAVNPDVYAWLEITDTDISFPVLQSSADEYFYLSHNMDGGEDDNGCIYTEYYNDKDFSDPNTVIYGRNRDARFGRLHQFRDRDFFDTHREVKIYLPDKVFTWQIFAAYTYDDRHLIATYDFADKTVFANYLEDVFAIRAMDAFIDSEVEVTSENRIITLSTGVTGQDDKRYLVQAVLRSE